MCVLVLGGTGTMGELLGKLLDKRGDEVYVILWRKMEREHPFYLGRRP